MVNLIAKEQEKKEQEQKESCGADPHVEIMSNK